MRRTASLLLVFATAIFIWSMALADEQVGRAIKLFDGKTLAGWGCFTVDPMVKMEDVWSVKEGILICKGEPLGYLYTKEDYTNFKLTVEWRWAPGKEPGNSGVLLRITGDAVSFVPKCAECQLKSGSAGDIVGFYGFQVKGPEDQFKIIEHPKLGRILAVRRIKAAEKDPGKWNRAEITVDHGTITVVINGEEVNKATDCDVVAGRIGLQSEGGEIHFSTVELIPIEK